MKPYFLIFLFVLFLTSIVSISGNTNNPLSIVENSKTDTNKVKMLSDLCYEYRFKSADSAIVFGEQALSLARELNYPKGIAQSCNDLAIVYINQASYRKAIKYLNESLKIREQLNDLSGIAALYNKLGIIDQKQGRLKEALEHQIAALKIYQKQKYVKGIGYSLNNIAIIQLQFISI
jgi:tetratricopeptide (TPR) repeat protein